MLAHIHSNVDAVRKLFSMFPSGAAGTARVLLRLVVLVLYLLDFGNTNHQEFGADFLVMLAPFLGMLIGFLTPLCCIFCATLETETLITTPSLNLHVVVFVLLIVVLGMIGPGAYSIDAKLYGGRLTSSVGRK